MHILTRMLKVMKFALNELLHIVYQWITNEYLRALYVVKYMWTLTSAWSDQTGFRKMPFFPDLNQLLSTFCISVNATDLLLVYMYILYLDGRLTDAITYTMKAMPRLRTMFLNVFQCFLFSFCLYARRFRSRFRIGGFTGLSIEKIDWNVLCIRNMYIT